MGYKGIPYGRTLDLWFEGHGAPQISDILFYETGRRFQEMSIWSVICRARLEGDARAVRRRTGPSVPSPVVRQARASFNQRALQEFEAARREGFSQIDAYEIAVEYNTGGADGYHERVA